MSNTKDIDIRIPLLKWLDDLYLYDDDTRIIEEMKVPRPAARVDVAVVNGELSGYEIKSDADTLFRLGSQIGAFTNVFDKINIVTTKKHLKKARKKIPNFWGIIIYECLDGESKFVVKRQAKKNTKVNLESLLYTLNKRELRNVSQQLSIKSSIALHKEEMVESIISNASLKQVKNKTKHELRNR